MNIVTEGYVRHMLKTINKVKKPHQKKGRPLNFPEKESFVEKHTLHLKNSGVPYEKY